MYRSCAIMYSTRVLIHYKSCISFVHAIRIHFSCTTCWCIMPCATLCYIKVYICCICYVYIYISYTDIMLSLYILVEPLASCALLKDSSYKCITYILFHIKVYILAYKCVYLFHILGENLAKLCPKVARFAQKPLDFS